MNDIIKLALGIGAFAVALAYVLGQKVDQLPPVVRPASTVLATPMPVTQLPQPVQAASLGFNQVGIPRERDGHYHVTAEIEGRSIPMLVDTGASVIALSYEDAQTAGLYPSPAEFKIPMSTANGISYAAPVMLRAVRVGQIDIANVQAVVAPRGAMSGSLVGMSFLSKLTSFQVAADNLVMTP